MNRTRTRIHSATAGFSLVEVMVAVVVICVGLLGIAKMQALSLSNTTTSRQRALAALQAASIASAMHSNRQYWANPAVANFSVSIQSSASSVGTPASNDAALLAQLQTNLLGLPNSLKDCIDTVSSTTPKCPAVRLAAFDLTRWWVNSLNPMLPNATATISCPQPVAGNPSPVACTVTITWTEKAVAVNSQEAAVTAVGQFERPNYMLYVQP